MATSAELLDVPVEYTFKDKVYKVSRTITFEMEVMVADWVYQSALDRLERQRQVSRQKAFGGMTEEQYNRQLDRICDSLASGKYEWEGDLVIQAMNQLPGNKFLTLLRFRKYDQTVTMQLIDDIFDSREDAIRLGQLLNPTPAAVNKDQQKVPAAEVASVT